MKLKMNYSYNVTPSKDIRKKWYLIDAKDKVLGKVAVKAARILRGKDKPIYTPNLDTGDNVVIINAKYAVVTGNKKDDKIYHSHSGYMGGLKTVNYSKLLEKKPIMPMEKAIKGMLPKGPLGRELFRNLRVYADDKYLQASQKPEIVNI